MLRICKHNALASRRSPREIVNLSRAFAAADKPIGAIVELIEHQLDAIDYELNNTKALYERGSAELYVAALLAKRSCLLEFHKYLTTYVIDEFGIED
jgi:hypothetical protein